MHHARRTTRVNAKVVPVDQEHQIGQAKPPRSVLRLMAAPRSEPSFAFHRENLDFFNSGEFERERLSRGRRHPVPGRTRVELEEQGTPRHLRVSRQPSAMTQPE